MYRPEIKIFDCTIRDGGLCNDHRFDHDLVRRVYRALAAAGVDYMEIGYRLSKRQYDPKKFGAWKFCDEDDIRQVAEEGPTKLSVMVDLGRVEPEDILPKRESIVHTIRVACYVKDIDKALHLARHVKEKGYETFVNIMAVSHALEPDLDEALRQLAASEVDGVYLVDSFGYLYCEQVQYLSKKYLDALPGKKVGIHMHNNQQLAFANTIEGIIRGINYLDCTIYGMGRGAGNCPTELLMGFLKNPKFDIRPILEIIKTDFVGLLERYRWGYQVPYMITGILNQHPRSAIKQMDSKEWADFVRFYDERVAEEGLD